MVALNELPPAEFAAQLGRPSGEIGVAVGHYMNDLNGRLIRAACGLLALSPNQRILEIGFGNGELIGEIVSAAPGLCYVGVDASETMVREAANCNRALIRDGKVELHLGSVDRLAFADATFDRALGLNTIYFWPDQLRGLAEIRRVLCTGGLLVLASMTPETSERSPTARAEYGFNTPDREKLESLLRLAGFGEIRFEPYEESAKRLDGSTFIRSYHIVLAR